MPDQIDPETLKKIEIVLQDPIAGPKLKAMLNDTTGGTGQPLNLLSALGQAGSAASQQKTPSSQLGAGIGSLGGALLGNLLKKKPSVDPMAGRDPNSPGPDSAAAAAAGPPPDEPAMPKDILPYYGDIDGTESDRRGGVVGRKKRKFAAGGDVAEEAPAPPAKRGILTRRPILSTTIVISPKKKAKAEKKKRGGRIKPRKPAAVPPLHGPGNGGPPAPFAKGGRVQVPRGSGCAQRGKQFRGIY